MVSSKQFQIQYKEFQMQNLEEDHLNSETTDLYDIDLQVSRQAEDEIEGQILVGISGCPRGYCKLD